MSTLTEETDRADDEKAASSAPTRSRAEDKAVIARSREFTKERPGATAWAIVSTFAVLAVSYAGTAPSLPLAARIVASVITGLTLVRGFILFHDVMHGALLRGSKVGRAFFWVFGLLVLTPAKVWKETHNYHHAHNAKMIGSHIGSYPTLTTAIWKQLKPGQQLAYKAARHPLTILFAHVTVFLLGMCLSSFKRDPKKHWSSLVAVLVHGALGVTAFHFLGWVGFLLTFLVPFQVAFISGAYLFYAQHNFGGMTVRGRTEWTYVGAALDSSSFLELGPVMRWFTGSIGYHHVHHLNPAIPFYRLEECMDEMPELQNPGKTSLAPGEVLACLRLKLWDDDAQRMVGYPKGTGDPAG